MQAGPSATGASSGGLFAAVCGTSTWDISFTIEGVDCLRCKGTQGFWDLKDKESARARLARLGDDQT
jgi:hypothetical protein